MGDGKIHTPERAMTEAQASRALKDGELPPCVGNPNDPCRSAPQPVMISGYDDKMRCPACNKIHVGLVELEAGESSPNPSAPSTVAPRLDLKAKYAELSRRKRIERMLGRLEEGYVDPMSGKRIGGQIRGGTGIPKERLNVVEIADGDYRDMLEAMSRDEHGTRADGISDEERRNRILAKYGKLKDGGPLQ